VNFLKLPFQLFAWHNINQTTLAIDACAIPFVLIGAFLGIRLVKFLPECGFRIFTTIVTHGLPSKKVMLFAKFLFLFVAVSEFFSYFCTC